MVKTVFKSDISLRNYCEKTEEIKVDAHMQACVSMCQPASAAVRCDVQIAEMFLYGNKLILIHTTTRFYAFRDKNLSAQPDLEFYASDGLGP
jgi:hypothetical protein